MRNVSIVLIGLTVILFTVFIICSLTTLSVKDDELDYSVGYAAKLTISSLDDSLLNGKNVIPTDNYNEYYHYDTAINDSINELYEEGMISSTQKIEIANLGFVHVSQILNNKYLSEINNELPDYFANIVLEKVFMNVLEEVKTSNATYEVTFYDVNARIGLLDVEVTQKSKFTSNKLCSTSVRKTVIKENFFK